MSESDKLKLCKRCGEPEHKDLVWKKFKHPIMPDVLNWGWETWATCPVTGDPLIKSKSFAKAVGEEGTGHWEWKWDTKK